MDFLLRSRVLAPFLGDRDRAALSQTCKDARDAVFHAPTLRYPPRLDQADASILHTLYVDGPGVALLGAPRLPHVHTLRIRGTCADLVGLLRCVPALVDLHLENWDRPPVFPPTLPPRIRGLCMLRCAGPVHVTCGETLSRFMCVDTRATLEGSPKTRIRQLIMRSSGLGTTDALHALSACPRLNHLDVGENPGVNAAALLVRLPRTTTCVFLGGSVQDSEEALDLLEMLRLHPRIAPSLRLLSVWGIPAVRTTQQGSRVDMGPLRKPLVVHGLTTRL